MPAECDLIQNFEHERVQLGLLKTNRLFNAGSIALVLAPTVTILMELLN
jgi:hypothetical protein